MTLTDEEVEEMKLKAVTDQLANETIQVTMVRSGLQFKIDHHRTADWVKELIRQGDPFRMVNLKTGKPLCELTEEQELKEWPTE